MAVAGAALSEALNCYQGILNIQRVGLYVCAAGMLWLRLPEAHLVEETAEHVSEPLKNTDPIDFEVECMFFSLGSRSSLALEKLVLNF